MNIKVNNQRDNGDTLNFYELPEDERREIMEGAGEEANKMQNELIKKANKKSAHYKHAKKAVPRIVKKYRRVLRWLKD